MDYTSIYQHNLQRHNDECVARTGATNIPSVIDGTEVKYPTIARIFSTFYLPEDRHRMFTLPEIDLYSIFLKYVPSSWYDCRTCSEYLRTVGKVVYYDGGRFTTCLRELTALSSEDLGKLPRSIQSMLGEMKENITAAALPYDRGEKAPIPVTSLPAPVGGPWSHAACFGPPIGFGNCVSQSQLSEYYVIIDRLFVRYGKIRHLLCRKAGRPGIITTDILNFTEDNVKTSAYICSMLDYMLANVDMTTVAWKYQMQMRKFMYGTVMVYLPVDEDWGRKLADYRVDNFAKLGMKMQLIPFDMSCMQALVGSAGSGGMLGCVCDAIIDRGYEKLPMTPERIATIRNSLPPNIKEAHLQHRKTAAESDAQIRNVTREIELKYGVGYLDRIPGVKHISVGQIKVRDAIFTNKKPITGAIPGRSMHKMSMTSFISLLRRLPTNTYNLEVTIRPTVYVFALIDYGCREILRDYPSFWYFLVNEVNCSRLGVRPGVRRVTFICARPDTPLNDNTSVWLIGIDGAQMSETGIPVFEDYLSINIDRTHYRTLTARTGSVASVADQACGITAHVNQNGDMREEIQFRVCTQDQMLFITVNTRRPDYCGDQLSVDDAFDLLCPRGAISPVASPSTAMSSPSAVDAAAPSECRVCMDAPKDHMLTPCNHICACQNCANVLKQSNNGCPICKKPISGYVRVYDT